MNVIESLRASRKQESRFGGLSDFFTFNGSTYPLGLNQTLTGDKSEDIERAFSAFASVYRDNGVVFAVENVRMSLFAEARFQFRRRTNGRPGELFGTSALSILETPWPNATTGDLLGRALQDADLAGNFFGVKRDTNPERIKRLRPDWMSIVLGSTDVPLGGVKPGVDDMEVAGYMYHPGGKMSGQEPVSFGVDEVMHFAPTPDPYASYRGMSWITPIIREIDADNQATNHKRKFFEQGATPNMVVKFDAPDAGTLKEWADMFREQQEGVANAYKTLVLGAGADATVVGSNFEQLDFKATQGAGETRIAAAGGVHPVIVGLSEGLAGSSLNQGNFSAARRLLSDRTMRPLWRNFAGSASSIVDVPASSELWYDDRDIPFLSEDAKDAADIQSKEATTLRTLVDGGFTPDSAVGSVASGDITQLVHSGMVPVQLQTPGSEENIGERMNAVGILIRSGFEPSAALASVGLDPITHFGLLPVTLQRPEDVGSIDDTEDDPV